jgi:hypothetical protein
MKKKLMILLCVIAVLSLLLMGCPLNNIITLTIINTSSVSGTDGTMTIKCGPADDSTPEVTKTILSPAFPYEHKIINYTPDEEYGIIITLVGTDSSQAGGSNAFDTADGGEFSFSITLQDVVE